MFSNIALNSFITYTSHLHHGESAACVIELAARILCASVLSVPFGYRAVCFATPFAWLTALSLLIPVYIVLIRKLDGGQSTQTKT